MVSVSRVLGLRREVGMLRKEEERVEFSFKNFIKLCDFGWLFRVWVFIIVFGENFRVYGFFLGFVYLLNLLCFFCFS